MPNPTIASQSPSRFPLGRPLRPLHTGPLQVERLTVAIAGLPATLDGCRIAQLSDFHYDGGRLSESLLDEAIARCNAESPDLVALTGDFVTDDPGWIDPLTAHLRRLEARAGLVACLGNHDLYYRESRLALTTALQGIGVVVLWNAVAYPLGPGLIVVGLAEYWSADYRPTPIFAKMPADMPRIVLSHNPDSANSLRRFRVDLQLSGHTHGGQIWLPGYGPLPKLMQPLNNLLPASLTPDVVRKCDRVVESWQYSRGPYRVGKNFLYVNRGLGTYFPGRWGCPPELAIFTLKCSG